MDLILPPQAGKHPAILLLHGSGGSSDYPQQVQKIAKEGYTILVPHYFESTGTTWADVDAIRRHGLTWGKTILDAVEFARKLPNVAPETLGLLGFSLGGFLAIAVAAHDTRIKCVVEFCGGLPEKFLPTVDRLPHILILHGEEDHVVSIHHARRLQGLCEEKKFNFEMEIYPGAGHNFSGRVMQTALKRTMAFFHHHLKIQPVLMMDNAS